MNEKTIQNKILALGRGACRLFRANSGIAWQGQPKQHGNNLLLSNFRKVQLMPKGTPDIIGFKTVEIMPKDIGKKVAVFVVIETKAPNGKITKEQANFLNIVREAGGMSGCAQSVEDAQEILGGK